MSFGTIILDPAEGISNRSALDITPWLRQEGPDWGDAAIEAVMSSRTYGEVPVDFTVPNREVSMPLQFTKTIGGTTVPAARAKIQAKIALFQREGGVIKRITPNGGSVYADIVDATTMGFSSQAGWEASSGVDIDPAVSLRCLPDFYQGERTLGDHVETTNPELIFTETAIKGDYPARCRIVVDDDQAKDQRGLFYGFRSKDYSAASTARLVYGAEELQPLDIAAKRSLAGATGGTVVRHGTISTSWTPIVGTNKGGTAYLTHTGSYNLWGRVYSTSGTTVQCRAVYDVGDLVNPVEMESWTLPGPSYFYDHNFGQIRLDPSPVGTHRWQGQIQARGAAGNENFSVDRIWLQPLDEGAGVLTAPPPSAAQGLATYSARDEFNQTAGTLTGKTLPVGGVWTAGTANDSDDFNLSGTPSFNVTRTSTNDTGSLIVGRITGAAQGGRAEWAGTTNYTSLAAGVDMKTSALPNTSVFQGLMVRWANAANYASVLVWVSSSFPATPAVLWVSKVIAGSGSKVAAATIHDWSLDAFYRLFVQLDASGNVFVYSGPSGSNLTCRLAARDSVFATGGVLASGRVGIWDTNLSTGAGTRTYDNFSAWVPTPDAVTYASRSTQLTTDGNVRLDTGGTAYGPVSMQAGDLPRLPVAGNESRTTQVILHNSRGDFDQIPAWGTATGGADDLSARITYRPSYLNVGTI